MKKLFLISMLLISSLSFGQKKFGNYIMGVTYSPSLSPLVRSWAVSDRWVVHHKGEIDFYLFKYLSVGVDVSYTQQKFNSSKYTTYQVKDFLVGGTVRYYANAKTQGTRAPNGLFFGLGFSSGQQNSRRVIENVDSLGNYLGTDYFYDDLERVPINLLSLQLGRNTIFGKHFRFGYGVEFGINLNKINNIQRRHLFKGFFSVGYVI